MKNNRTFTQFELNIIELFERLQNAEVTEDATFVGTFYVDYFNAPDYTDWVTESREDLLNYCIDGINQWYSETDTTDMLNNDFILENTTDYLQLLLTLPSDTTILAVGNGAVAAPSTTTAYLHQDYHGNKLLAVYDYETNELETKRDLFELFPTEPPTTEEPKADKPLTVAELLGVTETETRVLFCHIDAQNIGYECTAGNVPPMFYNFKISEVYTENNSLCVVIY